MKSCLNNSSQGFAYVEVLIATLLIVVVLPAALIAARTGQDSVDQSKLSALLHEARVTRLEFVRSQPYRELVTAAQLAGGSAGASLYSDPVGASNRLIVRLALYDADTEPFTVIDTNYDGDNDIYTGYSGLLWLEVSTQATPGELTTLIHPSL